MQHELKLKLVTAPFLCEQQNLVRARGATVFRAVNNQRSKWVTERGAQLLK